ncbi:hypothetical protein OsI_10596 [Oryza sativa Indica Group]|uniref:Uncharacterized protein n=1 Tax=Oryza sativa subsp. indica TaxID=39946 RepID=B8AJK6_ORYSI|nr:hypothetical protein OsI_10596 [Oryza sativa Indica Group]
MAQIANAAARPAPWVVRAYAGQIPAIVVLAAAWLCWHPLRQWRGREGGGKEEVSGGIASRVAHGEGDVS